MFRATAARNEMLDIESTDDENFIELSKFDSVYVPEKGLTKVYDLHEGDLITIKDGLKESTAKIAKIHKNTVPEGEEWDTYTDLNSVKLELTDLPADWN
jgi:hypothetical protein